VLSEIFPMTSTAPEDLVSSINRYHKLREIEEAEQKYHMTKHSGKSVSTDLSITAQIEKARAHIKESLQCMENIVNATTASASPEILSRLETLEKENSQLRTKLSSLEKTTSSLEGRLKKLEGGKAVESKPQAQQKGKAPPPPADDDDDVDLFGSDEDDAEAQKIRDQRVAEYAAKKSKKPVLIAKSNVILDVKPWDDETDMADLEKEVRKIKMDGHIWGASKLVPLAYGIKKLQISCVVEDEKVSIDELSDLICELEDYVQSVDVAAFNKV